jgi:hypothetical protein
VQCLSQMDESGSSQLQAEYAVSWEVAAKIPANRPVRESGDLVLGERICVRAIPVQRWPVLAFIKHKGRLCFMLFCLNYLYFNYTRK